MRPGKLLSFMYGFGNIGDTWPVGASGERPFWFELSEMDERVKAGGDDSKRRAAGNKTNGSPEGTAESRVSTSSAEAPILEGQVTRGVFNLYVLIGGRGTGKYTIVESIRSVLGLVPIGEEVRKAHEGIVRLPNGPRACGGDSRGWSRGVRDPAPKVRILTDE